ncbi:iron complex transport system substrate-binding protein [Knoellia remsis]|uniref:Iron complex transport system substrate-binding protein n=1 Tax=Knoellia remsis TaxID=407159 RepID=A0A2T0UU54_9MICO|nr:iron-siderophore ABC transporter substrate-binding protein [Knoellia remsis]PRY61455.1 iron complex transport system substrate-binding protein [Knoellia remsis]
MRSRATALAALLISLLLGLTACGSGGSADEPAASGGASGEGGTWPRTITHAMGTTEIKKQPVRVLALDNSYAEATLALQAQLVGFTQYRGLGETLPDYLGDARTAYAKDAKSVGTLAEPNLEQIAALQPDLIISAKVRHEKIYPQLSKIAPTVMSETTGAQWKDNMTMFGKALGKEDLAAQILGDYEKAAAEVGKAVNAKAGNPTISVVRFLDGPTRLYQKASFTGIILEDAGLARPPSQDVDDFAAEISEEKIKDADADKIFVTTYDAEDDKGTKTREQFAANPLWAPLAPKVVQVDDGTWMTSVSVQGAYVVLADLAKTFGVDAPENPLA